LDQFRLVDLFVPVARHLGRALGELGFTRARVAENVTDARRFVPAAKDPALLRALGIAGEAVVVAHVSNLKDVKRPLDVVASAARTLRERADLVYLVVGDGPGRAAMEEACARAGVAEHFRFTGWVEHTRIPAHLNLADVVVMPSESEGRALVYLETQACGRVLLASDILAAREVIADGETGVLFGKGDGEALAAKTLALAADPELRFAIVARARRAVAGQTIEGLVDEYEAILGGVIEGRRG